MIDLASDVASGVASFERRWARATRTYAPRPHKSYRQALELFWQGKERACLRFLGDELSKRASTPARVALYRLWVEVLAEGSDVASLALLADHLSLRAQAEPAEPGYLALKALIHLECDELQACRLYLSGLHAAEQSGHPYVLEVQERLSFRTDPNPNLALLRTAPTWLAKPGMDYLHASTLIQHALLAGCDVGKLCGYLEAVYPKAPLVDWLAMHTAFEAGDDATAADANRRLCDLYPKRLDYQFQQGYLATRLGQTAEAITALEGVHRKTQTSRKTAARSGLSSGRFDLGSFDQRDDVDADVSALLSHNYLRLASRWGKQAEMARLSHGLPARGSYRVARMLEGGGRFASQNASPSGREQDGLAGNLSGHLAGEEASSSAAMSAWFSKLSASQVADFQARSEEDVEQMHWSLGKFPRAGDLWIAAAPSTHLNEQQETVWRILAIYEVTAQGEWHPYLNYTTQMQLLLKPERPVPIDIVLSDDESAHRLVSRKHPLYYGAFELDGDALDVIIQRVKEVCEEDEAWRAETDSPNRRVSDSDRRGAAEQKTAGKKGRWERSV